MSATVHLQGGTLGDQLPALADVGRLIGNLLTDPTPGGVADILQQADEQINQIVDEVDRLRGKKASLEANINILQQLVTTITGALGSAGVATLEFSGTSLGEVLSEIGKNTAIPGRNSPVYGLMLLASTPDADRALNALIGVGRTMRLP